MGKLRRKDGQKVNHHTRLTKKIDIEYIKAIQYDDYFLEKIVAEKSKRSFYYFMQEFWECISTDKPKWNWHISYLCNELNTIAQNVANYKPSKSDTIINIPPGTTKSITVNVMFPVWCWTNWYWMRFISASYSASLSLEQAELSRELVRHEKFRQHFPYLDIKRDKDTKSNYRIIKYTYDEDTKAASINMGGGRYSTSVGGTLTGFHGHILLVDDPLNPNKSVSTVELNNANRWIDQTLSTRKIEKSVTPTILIMQRLAQNDPSGHILNKPGKKVKHICLPGEIRNFPDELKPQKLKKFYKDDLLDSVRMPWAVLDDLRIDLGQYGYAGQVGQKPTPPGGGMFQVNNISYIHRIPTPEEDADFKILSTIRYWDKAGSPDKGDYTVGLKMHRLKSGKYLISDIKRGQWASNVRERIIKSTAEADGKSTIIFLEQEPGSGGKESVENSIRNLAGYSVYAERPTGEKAYRADPFSVQINNGNVILLNADWNSAYIDELRFFPYSMNDDQIDASSGAFNKLTKIIKSTKKTLNLT